MDNISPSLAERAQDRLRQSGYSTFQHIRCTLDGDSLILQGEVRSYYLRQIIISICLSISGVEHIDDRIQVIKTSEKASSGL